MADDTNQQGTADRSQVAASEGYEVAYFAKKHGLTQKTARELIAEVGNDREKLDAAAQARGPSAPKTPPKNGAKRAPKSADASPSPAKQRTPSKSVASTAPRRRAAASGAVDKTVATAALDAVTEPVAAAIKTVRRRAAVAVQPVADSGAATTKSIGERARTVMRAARRSSASARKHVAAAPAAVGKSAGRALDATRSATKSRTAAVLGAAAAGLVTGLAVNLGRKVIVQAPSVMAGDWFEAVRLEHKLALGLFDAIEATTDAEPAKRMMLLIQLTHALSKHAFTEENVVYPALRDWGDKADADKLNHDHGYVKQHLYELNAMEPVSAAFLPKIAIFRSELENHIREEEEAIFPPLHAALGETGNARITAMANKEGFKLA